jgi:hypothetical protein
MKELVMKTSVSHLTIMCSALLALGSYSSTTAAQELFFDDFEDRVADQAFVGHNWTWYDQTFPADVCNDDDTPVGFGPKDNGGELQVENRNFFTASEEAAGQGDSYFRAGLEVPAWATDEGTPVLMSNMLRVYGNQYNEATTCARVLVFQERTIEAAGTYAFSFDVAQDRSGAPANGEVTAAFVKVLDPSNGWNTDLIQSVKTIAPAASTPFDVTTVRMEIAFTITEDMIGKLLQFGFYADSSVNLGQSWANAAVLYDNVRLGPIEIGPAHSGTYFNRDQSGHGFSIEFGELPEGSPLGVVYWYTYDDMGNPIFMLGNGVPNGQTLEVTFYSPTGMEYGVWQKPTENDGGTAVLVFSDRENATFSYTPSSFTASEWGHTPIEALPLIKFFGIPADKYFSSQE